VGNRQSLLLGRRTAPHQAARRRAAVGNRQSCRRRSPNESGLRVGNRQSESTRPVNNQSQSVEKLCISCGSAVYYTPCDCRLPTRRCLLHTGDCLLPTKRCLLPTGPLRKSLSAFVFLALFGPKTLKLSKTYLKPVCVPQPAASRLRLPAPPGACGALRPRPPLAAFPTRHRHIRRLRRRTTKGDAPLLRATHTLRHATAVAVRQEGGAAPSNIAVMPPHSPLETRSSPG